MKKMHLSRIKDKILDNYLTFSIVRFLFGGHKKAMQIVKNQMAQTKNKKVLDVGCGLGNYSKIIDGFYVGADINKSFIKFASMRYGKQDKYFVIFDATRICFKSKAFHKSLFISMLHHFPNTLNSKILKEMKRVTKEEIFILDLNPEIKNPFIKFFYSMDRGSYIRPLENQISLISKFLKIKKTISFISGTSLHSLFICTPKN